ncbi:uncharacterized protein lrrfip1a isoform X3 [Coregonus clupeaformis]|uniref:uncharacterized protein lrrfip1a isoform X3 n=1 Tax=Coregonus clupeaformis TaxID=59861 RepID=UPI001BDF93A5|nr:uncharacterized protein lrrfip1a isoform X3 [Coregonus clupeaformis]
MGTQGTGRKRNPNKDRSTAEDDALNLIAREAEARLAAKRAARAEAREIRMKELERQQKEIYQVQKKYYGLDNKSDKVDSEWGHIEQWMEDSERYSRPSQRHTSISDDDERMSVGSRGSVRSDLDAIGAYGRGGSSSLSQEKDKKSKKKKKHKHKDRDSNGYDNEYSAISSRSSRLVDESTSRVSRSSRLDLQPASYASSDLNSNNGLSSSRQRLSSYESSGLLSQISYRRHHRGSLYEDSLYSGARRVTGSSSRHSEYSSYRGSSSRASSRASSARASPVDDDCNSVASFLRSVATSSGLPRDLDHMTIPNLSNVEDRDYLEKGSRAASTLSAATLASLGGSSSRRGSGETSITGDTETSIREIKEIHELKDQIQDVESKYMQSLKEVKDTLVEVEEKYRKAMVSNAQLDNEKNNLMYQVDTLKDSLMELEELLSESRREYEGKSKDFEREKHAHGVLQFQFNEMKEMLKQSEELLTEIRQMRLKQDSFVREISDLQETVEWKDKKIGALERQKEYSDAIRNERDELRDEVVQLKDILKKHGIVLRPDLTTNGETLELGTEGSASGDPASQLVQDSQTSPMEGGNSMLGRAQEMELESRGDKVVDPGRSRQQEDTYEEEAQENHLISPTPCSLAGVSETETSREAQPFSPTLGEEVEIESSDVNKDSDNGIPVVEVKRGPVCDSEVLGLVTGPEEEVTGAGEGYEAASIKETGQGRVEVAIEGEMGIKNDKADDAETKVAKSSDDTKETSSKEPTSEYGVAAEQEKIELSKEVVKSIDSCPPPRETIEDTMKNGTQISQGTDLDTSKSPIKSNPEPQKTKKAEALPEITDLQPQAQAGNKKKKGKKKKGETQSDEKQEDHKKSTTETCVVSMTNSTQISLGTDLDTSKSPVESNPDPQPEPQKTKKVCVLPETTDTQPQAQGGKKKKKGKRKGEKQGDETHRDKMSKTEKDMVSTPTDKEPVEELGEGVITIETQQLLEGTSRSPERELQSPEEKAQEEEEQLAEERVEVKSEEPTIEVSLTDQAKSEEVVTKKKKKKIKKDKQKPTMESEKSEGKISVVCLESNIGIADPVDHSKCITSAENPMEELESTTNTGTQKDESGYTTNPDNFIDCLNSSADPKCPLDSKQSTAGNSNNVKEEDVIKVSVKEAQTIQDTKEQGNNFHSPIVLRLELEKSVEPEDLIFHDGVTTHPDHASENATQDLKEAGQDKQIGSPEECTNALEHEDMANVEKCNNSSDEKCCSTSLDSNCPAAETIRRPEQLVDLPGCPVTDKHLHENNKLETLDAEEASNGGISTETELNYTETRPQDPLKETLVTIDSFREQSHNESGPCTMVAKAKEQDDPIEAKLESNKVPGPSEQGNDEEKDGDENEKGQSFDFSDIYSVVPANVFPIISQEEVSQEVRTMSVGYKIEVEPGRAKANNKEEDDKPQHTVEGVSTIVAQQSIEGWSDSAPEELQSPEEKAQTIVEGQNVNEEQQLITVEEGVSVTYEQKDIAQEGVSVTVEQHGVEESERQQNATEVEAWPLEEGEEAIQYGSQQGRRESSQSTEDSAGGDNEQSRTGLKKGSKKGKGKGKEDCRMA